MTIARAWDRIWSCKSSDTKPVGWTDNLFMLEEDTGKIFVSKDGAWVDAIQTNVAPMHTVILWAGGANTVPRGWAVCDGTSGRPRVMAPNPALVYIVKT